MTSLCFSKRTFCLCSLVWFTQLWAAESCSVLFFLSRVPRPHAAKILAPFLEKEWNASAAPFWCDKNPFSFIQNVWKESESRTKRQSSVTSLTRLMVVSLPGSKTLLVYICVSFPAMKEDVAKEKAPQTRLHKRRHKLTWEKEERMDIFVLQFLQVGNLHGPCSYLLIHMIFAFWNQNPLPLQTHQLVKKASCLKDSGSWLQ